jgi:hypothetical protein
MLESHTLAGRRAWDGRRSVQEMWLQPNLIRGDDGSCRKHTHTQLAERSRSKQKKRLHAVHLLHTTAGNAAAHTQTTRFRLGQRHLARVLRSPAAVVPAMPSLPCTTKRCQHKLPQLAPATGPWCSDAKLLHITHINCCQLSMSGAQV